jgi:two-component system C4-dicarboxylate transport sensor histidine kinase DctB
MILVVLAIVVSALAGQFLAGLGSLSALRAEARQTLDLQLEVLTGQMDKYRILPPLLARQPAVRALFESQPVEPAARQKAHDIALEAVGLSGALDLAFLTLDGKVFASARGMFDDGPAAVASAFEQALQGRLGRAAVLLPDRRAYAFAAPVRDGNRVNGAVVAFVGFERIEQTWSLARPPMAVTAGDGRIFLSSRPDWISRNLSTGDTPLFGSEPADGGDGVVRLSEGTKHPYYMLSRSLLTLGWRFHIFEDYQPVTFARLQGALVGAMSAALLLGGLWFALSRRAELAAQFRRDRIAAIRLERQVRDRTAKLTASNRQLGREVEERRLAEERLRKAQADLIQSAKLATIGQMSTTLSHEYNQPLAAIRTHADNARQFLDLGNPSQAGRSLDSIAAMVDRISALTRSLLSFARKPGSRITPIALDPVIAETLMLTGPRAKKSGVAIERDVPEGLHVMGGAIRLTQVLVNLVNNALDAIEPTGKPGRIRIAATEEGDHVRLSVEDNGVGVPPEERERIFEPFHTTKESGKGLGIGLSLVHGIIKDLGGHVEVGESDLGGARFAFRLARAETAATHQLLREDAG